MRLKLSLLCTSANLSTKEIAIIQQSIVHTQENVDIAQMDVPVSVFGELANQTETENNAGEGGAMARFKRAKQ